MITKTSSPILWEELIKIVDYCPDTGIFIWKETRGNNATAGDIAGSSSRDGYIRIYLGGRPYLAHRLAWLHSFKEWPDNIVDHINGIRSDNRLDNLRDVTIAENNKNRGTYKKTEYEHVYAKHNIYVAEIRINIGEFTTKESAYAAVEKYKKDNNI